MKTKISSNPKDANHLYKKGSYWYWQVHCGSAYGMAGGRAKTKALAIVNAKIAIAELMTYY
jgi:hypothetical protein